MTIPKWLLPVIAIVAALAVGVAAALVGARFASTQVSAHPGTQKSVPMIAPVAGGQKSSPIVGSTLISEPGTAGGDPISSSQRALIDAVISSPNPGHTIDVITGGAGADSGTPAGEAPSTGATSDDPCSPTDGSAPPSGCPSGITGIIPIDNPVPLSFVNPFPFPARIGHVFDATCGTTAPAAGIVPVGIASGAPVDATLAFWPTSNPSDRHTVDYSTSSADRAAFARAEGTARTPLQLPEQLGCPLLHVDPATAYTGLLTGFDSLMRPIPPTTFLFNSSGTPVHPELETHTIGGNLLFLSALHQPGERVEFHVINADTPSPTCDSQAIPGLTAVSVQDTTVSADDLNAANVDLGNTVRTTVAYLVLQGSNMMLCARWFPQVGHSWDRSRATWQSLQFAESPATLSPNLNLDSITGPGLTGVTVSVSSGAGTSCGNPVTWNPADPERVDSRQMPVSMCFPEIYGGAHADGSRFWDTGLDPNLVVSISGRTSHGTIDVTRAIAAGTPPCSGSCPAPAPAPFVIPIGDGGANAHLTLSYTGGAINGHASSTWVLGGVDGTLPSNPAPDAPQLDTDQAVTAINQHGVTSGITFAAIINVPITADRPVDYSIHLVQQGGFTTCVRPGGVLTVTGHLNSASSISIPNMCLDTRYEVQLTLTDAAGHRSIWGQATGDPAHFWGDHSLVTTPTLTGTLHYDFKPRDGGRMDWAGVTIAGQAIPQISTDFGGFCRQDGLYESQGNVPNFRIGQVIDAEVRYAVSALPYGANGPCTLRSETTDEVRDDQATTIDQLLTSPDGVVLTDPKWTLKLNFLLAP